MQPRTKKVFLNLGLLWGIVGVLMLCAYSIRKPASVLDDAINPDARFLFVLASLIAVIGTPLVIRYAATGKSSRQGGASMGRMELLRGKCGGCQQIMPVAYRCQDCGAKTCEGCAGALTYLGQARACAKCGSKRVG